jgi:hypothetical protein
MNIKIPIKKKGFIITWVITWVVIGLLSLCWWKFESNFARQRFALAVSLSMASFAVGSIIGFLFSSHSEEADTIGKIRDWFIGGIATLTIAKAAQIKATITTFAADPGPNGFALALGGTVAYAALGFAFMYFLREIYLNPQLAERRRERGIIEGTRSVDHVVKNSSAKLPPSILSNGPDVSDISNPEKKEAACKLKPDFYSPDVDAFLDQVMTDVEQGCNVNWDDVAKVANIHYYRTYFEKKEAKPAQARLALEWIQRVLLFNPHNIDMITKSADMLTVATCDYAGAVSILERLVREPAAPLMVRQWLGYFLLYLPHRACDAICYSNLYRKLVGEDTDSLFNIACAYAQAYCEGPGAEPGLEDHQDNHDKALQFLDTALQREPSYASVVSKWVQPGESFACFAKTQLSSRSFRRRLPVPSL